MSLRLEYGENYLEVFDFCFYREDAKRGIPVNITFSLAVQSCGFRGVAPCEYDIEALKRFSSGLHKLYNFEIERVFLEDQGYGSRVLFFMKRTGRMEVSGKIHGYGRIHSLDFCFEADQTVLKSFLDGLDELICNENADAII